MEMASNTMVCAPNIITSHCYAPLLHSSFEIFGITYSRAHVHRKWTNFSKILAHINTHTHTWPDIVTCVTCERERDNAMQIARVHPVSSLYVEPENAQKTKRYKRIPKLIFKFSLYSSNVIEFNRLI